MLSTFACKSSDVKSAVKSIPLKTISPVWMKAAVAGSIWASLEIIIGSFLHNLRLPFSGTILAVMSVWLLVAFMQIWDEKGLVWRAGLICALMKSVSPSAVILGPMTGILIEALLLESFIRLFGRNILGYLVGGAAAVLSSLLHKIATLLILYGFDLFKIFTDIYMFAVRQIKMEDSDPWVVVVLIAVIYITAGLIASTGGFLSGQAYLKKKNLQTGHHLFAIKPDDTLFSHTSSEKYSIVSLLLNIIFMTLSLTLLNVAPLIPALLFGLVYVIFVFIYYKNSIYRLRKPGIWIQFLLIALISAFLWNSVSYDTVFDPRGLMAGFRMIWRALIVITGFAAISVEMKNPLIKSVLYNRGLANLYQSLTLAFSALPSIMSRLPSPGEIFRRKHNSFSFLLSTAESLLPILEKEHSKRPDVFILTGDKEQGKTLFMKEIIRVMRNAGIKLAGFISEGIHSDNVRTGFRLRNVSNNKSIELCSTINKFGGLKQGKFWFNPEALAMGEEILGSSTTRESSIVIIDEVGPLEINGTGWYQGIEKATIASKAIHIWTARRSLAQKAARRWYVGNVFIVDIGMTTPGETASIILDALKNDI